MSLCMQVRRAPDDDDDAPDEEFDRSKVNKFKQCVTDVDDKYLTEKGKLLKDLYKEDVLFGVAVRHCAIANIWIIVHHLSHRATHIFITHGVAIRSAMPVSKIQHICQTT